MLSTLVHLHTTPASHRRLPPRGALLRARAHSCADERSQVRDLRVVDRTFRNQLPTLLVRRAAVVVALEHVRAIITSHNVLLFDADDQECAPQPHREPQSVG